MVDKGVTAIPIAKELPAIPANKVAPAKSPAISALPARDNHHVATEREPQDAKPIKAPVAIPATPLEIVEE